MVVFSGSCDFPVCGTALRWAYEKLSGVNTYYGICLSEWLISSSVLVFILFLMFWQACAAGLKSQTTEAVCCHCNLSCFSEVPWCVLFDRLVVSIPNLLQSGVL